jgi:hypothetical protein
MSPRWGALNIGPDPPSYNERPWYNQVLETRLTLTSQQATFNYTVDNLLDTLKANLSDTVAKAGLEVRLFKASIWNISGGSLLFQPYQYTTSDTTQTGGLRALVDHPARNQWARTGFKWPPSCTNIVLETPTKEETLFTVGSKDAQEQRLLVYLYVKWRFNTAYVPTVFSRLNLETN